VRASSRYPPSSPRAKRDSRAGQVQYVIIGRENHQHQHQAKPDPEAHLLCPLGHRAAADSFDRIEQEVPAIQQRNRKQVQQSDGHGKNGGKMDQRAETDRGDLPGDLSDPNRSPDLVGVLAAGEDPANPSRPATAPWPG